MKRQAVVVGINRYPFLKDANGKTQHLTAPASDAEAIAQLLEKPKGDLAWNVQRLPEVHQDGKFRVGDAETVSEDQLSESILSLLHPRTRRVPDVALLFFAGHGLRREPDGPRQGFFAPNTAASRKNKWLTLLDRLRQLLQKFSVNNLLFFIRNGFRRQQNGKTEGFLATSDACPRKNKWGVPLSWLREILLTSPVKKQIVWLDCCHSGELLNFLSEAELKDWLSGGDRCLIAACRDDGSAYALGERGVLTEVLLQALDPAQQSEDNWITTSTVTAFVEQQLDINPVFKRQIPLFRNFGERIKFWQGTKAAASSQFMAGTSPAAGDTGESLENEMLHRRRFIPDRRCRIVWGRDDLIEKVLSRLTDPQELSIFSVSGGPGYGKTEAACEIAQAALRKNLFSEVLWVMARDTELVASKISNSKQSEALNWDRFLHEIAQQLECPVERVRQHLREEKRLVVLDNAETAEVEDILVNLNKMLNPSRALLTSRLQTNPSFVGLIPIQGLEEMWSHKLLRDEAEYQKIQALLQASEEQLHRVHELSCGAPLALHFLVGLVRDEQAMEPALSALEQASGEVEVFYRFTLETAWQRIADAAKSALRYMGQADASIPQAELLGAWGLSDSDWKAARKELKRWYLIAETQDAKGERRYDLHPWVRSSVRGGLVEKWEEPSLPKLEEIAKWKYGV